MGPGQPPYRSRYAAAIGHGNTQVTGYSYLNGWYSLRDTGEFSGTLREG
jgi:hypothetical protein